MTRIIMTNPRDAFVGTIDKNNRLLFCGHYTTAGGLVDFTYGEID
jgi:hypothetical protein